MDNADTELDTNTKDSVTTTFGTENTDGSIDHKDADSSDKNEKNATYEIKRVEYVGEISRFHSNVSYKYRSANDSILKNEFKKAKRDIKDWKTAASKNPGVSLSSSFVFIENHLDFNPHVKWIGKKPYKTPLRPAKKNAFARFFETPNTREVNEDKAKLYGVESGEYDLEALNEGLSYDYKMRMFLENAIRMLTKVFYEDKPDSEGNHSIESFGLVRILAWYSRRLDDEICLYREMGATLEDPDEIRHKKRKLAPGYVAPQWNSWELGRGGLLPSDETIRDIADLQCVSDDEVRESIRQNMIARFDVWVYSYFMAHALYADSIKNDWGPWVDAAMMYCDLNGCYVDPYRWRHDIMAPLSDFYPTALNVNGVVSQIPEWDEIQGLRKPLFRKRENTRDLLDEMKAGDLGSVNDVSVEDIKNGMYDVDDSIDIRADNYRPGIIDENMPDKIRMEARELWFHGAAIKNTAPTPIDPEHKNWPVDGCQYYKDMTRVLNIEYFRRPAVTKAYGTDLETTGLNAMRDYVIDQGLESISLKAGDLSTPYDLISISYGVPALREALGNPSEDICHISIDDIRGLLPFDSDFGMQRLVLDYLRRGTYVAHSAGFENAFFQLNVRGYAEAKRNDLVHIIDTRKLSRRLDPHMANDLDSYAKRMAAMPADENEKHNGLEDTHIMDLALSTHLGRLGLKSADDRLPENRVLDPPEHGLSLSEDVDSILKEIGRNLEMEIDSWSQVR